MQATSRRMNLTGHNVGELRQMRLEIADKKTRQSSGKNIGMQER